MLELNECLEEKVFENFGKSFNVPTEKGEQWGIRYEVRKSMRGVDYIATVYGKSAQEYIVKNLEKIIAGEVAG